MKQLFLTLFLISFFPLGVYSQKCGADHYHEEQMKDPEYSYFYEIAQRAVQSKLNSGERFTCTNTIVVPLAFHFNGAIDNSNMTCILSQINSQIRTLNEDFGGYNSDISKYCQISSSCPTQFPPNVLGSNSCIQFCLASILPSGQSSPITFGKYVWPSAPGWTGIFNVFVSDVAPPDRPAGLLGVAPLGGAANPNGNGMFIKNFAFGSAAPCTSGIPINNNPRFNKGRTGTHEAGHYFGLKHIFSGCSNGDGIADTPDQSTDNSGVPVINTTNCTSTALNSCSTLDFFFNYMDYVDDKAMFMFTDDQMQVMNGYASSQSKWTGGCSAAAYTPTYVSGCPAGSAPVANFTNDYGGLPLCPALAKISLFDSSLGFPSAWSWTFSGAGVSPTSSTEQNPMITYSSNGTIVAKLVAINSAGRSVEKTINIPVSVQIPSACGNCGQTFVDDGGTSSNYNAFDKTYVLCASSPSQTIQVDFTSISLEPFMTNLDQTDHIEIYNGAAATGIPVNYIFGTTIYTLNGSSLSGVGSTFVGKEQCATFLFNYSNNTSSATFPGWVANVTCIPIPTCRDGVQNQNETFIDCGGACPPCADVCDNFLFTDVGGSAGNAGSSQKMWQLCATAPDKAIVDFTTIDLGPGSAQLQIFEGTAATGTPAYLLDGPTIFKNNGSGAFSSFSNNTISSIGQCLTFSYVTGASPGIVPGWVSTINCCKSGTCPSATNGGRPIVNAMVSTVCPGYNLTNFAMFRNEVKGDRACTTPNLEFKSFYMVRCDASGGTLGVDVSANSNGGNVQAGLFGPLTGGCPNYAGGTYVDCEDGANPAALIINNAPPNSLYAVVLTSERAGDFVINTTPGSAVLPVVLSAFSATPLYDDIQLSWITESEINSERFEIERSNDGVTFETIASVEGKQNSKEKTDYNYNDKSLPRGLYYYRLKQIDFDGQFAYSDIVSVEINNSNESVNLFPNPTNNLLFIETTGNIEEIVISNFMGQSMLVKLGQKNQNRRELDLGQFTPGMYYIKMKVNGKEYKRHFIKAD
jgi:PKD repeat protein